MGINKSAKGVKIITWIVVIIIILGGIFYMDNKKNEEVRKEKIAATQLANFLKNIEIIKFQSEIKVVSSLAGALIVSC